MEEFQARFEHFQELKPCFAFLVNPFNVNVSVMAVQFTYRLSHTWLLQKLNWPKWKKSGSKKTSVNATLQLISGNRFQEGNDQNKRPVYNSFLHTARHIAANFVSL